MAAPGVWAERQERMVPKATAAPAELIFPAVQVEDRTVPLERMETITDMAAAALREILVPRGPFRALTARKRAAIEAAAREPVRDRVSSNDAIFGSLRLWRDTDHNGVSETTEISTLTANGIISFDLDHRTSRRTDMFGNQFKFRAKVRSKRGMPTSRLAWDVYLVSEQ